mmetsp:Transcript_24303/g.77584  ORF Transcript_24303/g.77584 Transcript_24303/m.77584 type:complete len:105 (-) Transcript_24303:94-408(-)
MSDAPDWHLPNAPFLGSSRSSDAPWRSKVKRSQVKRSEAKCSVQRKEGLPGSLRFLRCGQFSVSRPSSFKRDVQVTTSASFQLHGERRSPATFPFAQVRRFRSS